MEWGCKLETWAEQVSAMHCTQSGGITNSFNWNESIKGPPKCARMDMAETVCIWKLSVATAAWLQKATMCPWHTQESGTRCQRTASEVLCDNNGTSSKIEDQARSIPVSSDNVAVLGLEYEWAWGKWRGVLHSSTCLWHSSQGAQQKHQVWSFPEVIFKSQLHWIRLN